MKKIYSLLLIGFFLLKSALVFAQCEIEIGKDTGIVCGEAIELSVESKWKILNSDSSKNFSSVFFTDANTGYVVGDGGVILKTSNGGRDFTTLTSGTLENLYTIYFTNADTGYVLGNNGLILKTIDAGVNWISQTSGTAWGLHAIFFTDTNTGYVGGDAGLIIKTTNGGNNWVQLTTGVNTMFRSFYFTSNDTGYAVGYNGGILKTTNGGGSWTTKYIQPNVNFTSIWFTSIDTGYVAGMAGNGLIMKTFDGGDNWVIQFNESIYLNTIWFTSKNIGYAIGHNSLLSGEIILKTMNGGLSWASKQLPASGSVRSIFYTDANNGYIVGSNGIILQSKGMDTYLWTPSLGLSSNSISNPIAHPNVTTTYTVTAQSDSCTIMDSVTIYVNPLLANAGLDHIVNSGDSTQLDVSVNAIGVQELEYKWMPSTGLSIDSIANPFAQITENTNYIVTVSINGCEAIDTVNVSLSMSVDAGADKTILCSKGVQLEAESGWINLISGTTNSLQSVYFSSADTGYVAGSKDIFKTVDGGINWVKKNIASTINSVRAIYFTSTNIGYAVGNSNLQMDGAILKTTDGGNTWTTQTFSGSSVLNAISFPSASIGYAVGNPGKIYKTINGGNSWIAQNSGTTNFLNSVCFINTSVGFAFGGATILKTINGGSSWVLQTSLTTDEITSAHFISADTGYFVTAHGELWKSVDGGDNWVIQTNSINANTSPNFSQTFLSIDFVDNNIGNAVSKYMNMPQPQSLGAIFKTSDGGLHWERQLSDSSNSLYAVHFANAQIGYAVGDKGTILKLPLPPDSYLWNPPTGLSSATIANPIASPIKTTRYAITGITNGCRVTDSITIFVNPLTVNAGEDRGVVCGDSATLIVKNVFFDISASHAGSTWVIKDTNNKVWLSGLPEKDTTGYIYLPDGQYTFICHPKVLPPPIHIRVMPFAQDSISEHIYFTNDTVISKQFNVVTDSKYSYSWSPAQSIVTPTSIPINYSVQLTTPEGCNASDSVTISPVPIKINAGTDKTIVCGAVANFDTLSLNYTGQDQLKYKWLPATGLNSDTIANPFSIVNDTTVYLVSVLNASGCSAVDTVKVIVNPLVVMASDRNITCGDTAKLTTAVNYTGVDSLTYIWSPALGLDSINIPNPIATVYSYNTYTVKVTTPNGCLAADTLHVSPNPFNAIDICITGVDNTNKNLIVWNKPLSKAIDSFYLYRETNVTGNYSRIGAVSYDSFSTFIDITSFPDIQSNKYRIAIKDKCSLESPPSMPHKTMHLSINKGIGNTWNLIWDPYEGFTVSTYNIYRGTSTTNLILIGTSSGSNTQYSDINAPSGDVYYQVEVVSPNSCNPSKTYNTSRSNISSSKFSGVNEGTHLPVLFSLYPNPSSTIISLLVNTNVADRYTLNIFDMAGVLVKTEDFFQTQHQVSISHLANGVYIVEIKCNGYSGKQKLIIQK